MVTRRKRARRRKARRNASYLPVLNPRRRRRRRARRRNSWFGHTAGHRRAAKLGWSRKRSGRKALTKMRGYKKRWRKARKTRKNPFRSHRRRYYRRNPFHARRRTRRHYRRNPMGGLRKVLNKAWLMQILTAGAGLVAGFLAIPLVYRLIPATYRDSMRKYLGGVHIALGALLTGMRNKNAKALGMSLAVTGVYDLLSQNVVMLGLPQIPTTGMVTDNLLGPLSSSYEVSRRPVSAVSGRLPALAASYSAPSMSTVGLSGSAEWAQENPYEGIF